MGHWFLHLHIDGVVLTAADARIDTGQTFLKKKHAKLSTRQINQLCSIVHHLSEKETEKYSDPTHYKLIFQRDIVKAGWNYNFQS